MFQRVVVTGLGTVNPLSDNVEDFWENLILNKNGINKISHFDIFLMEKKQSVLRLK